MKLPQSVSEHCVHSLTGVASCSACVDACPRQAWILGENALGFDAEACDGCGLCRAACRTGAILLDQTLATGTWAENCCALAACERSDVGQQTEATLPCIHSLGLQQVLQLYRRGISRLVVAIGDCDRCERGHGPRLEQCLLGLNRSLRRSGDAPFMLERKPAKQWLDDLAGSKPLPSGPVISRRHFLRAFSAEQKRAAQGARMVLGLAGESFVPPARLLPELQPDSLLPHVPEIEPRHCSGCDACIRICPQNAVTLESTPNGLAYRLQAVACTGCGVCADICDQGAVQLRDWAVQTRRAVKLRELRCPACGVRYHEPEAATERQDGYCRICSKNRHRQRLYQVL